MDSRHQSIEQELLNNLVYTINHYIVDNIDDFIEQDDLQAEFKEISFHIYAYAKQWVDIEGIFSKKNLLSIDTVLLPEVDEEFIGCANGDFAQVVKDIEDIINQHKDSHSAALQAKLKMILQA